MSVDASALPDSKTETLAMVAADPAVIAAQAVVDGLSDDASVVELHDAHKALCGARTAASQHIRNSVLEALRRACDAEEARLREEILALFPVRERIGQIGAVLGGVDGEWHQVRATLPRLPKRHASV